MPEDRPSAPLIKWLRSLSKDRGLNGTALGEAAGIPRARLRKTLSGQEPMLVDELLAVLKVLQVSLDDLGFGAIEGVDDPESEGDDDSLSRLMPADDTHSLTLDAWGNQPQQLFQVGFALACDFLFMADTSNLKDSGVPAYVLERYADRPLPIKLDALYHRHNAPRFSDAGVTLTLSFDAVYDCTFPWSAIQQIVFFPVRPDPPALEVDEPGEKPKGAPFLRLVE